MTKTMSQKSTQRKPLPVDALAHYRKQIAVITDEPRYKAYLITNTVSGSKYVGITERRLKDRWRQHFRDGIRGDGYALHAAMNKYGVQKFIFSFIACAETFDDLIELEKLLIHQYQSVEQGYNLTRGGAAADAAGTATIVENKQYISLNAAARAYGIPEYSVHQRIERYGWTLEQALGIEPPPKKDIKRKSISVGPETFPNLRAAARSHGINEGTVRSRLALGWTVEQAFGLETAPNLRAKQKGVQVEIDGHQYDNLGQLAASMGISNGKIGRRLRAGWTLKQAIDREPPPQPQEVEGTEIVIQGKNYISIAEAARALGIDYNLARNRISLGWSPEQATDLAPAPSPSGEKNGHPIVVEHVEYTSLQKACEAYGLNYKMVSKRLKHFGWSIPQAFNLEDPPVKPSNNRVEIEIDGTRFESTKAACKYFGILVSTFQRRIKQGMSLEEALKTPSRKKKI